MKSFYKKVMALVLGFVVAGSCAVFADEILYEIDDFYEDWIVGTWELNAEIDQGEGVETTTAIAYIDGCDEDSDVTLESEDGDVEETTLGEYLESLFTIKASAGMTSEEFEAYKPVFEEMGFELYGDLDWHVNDDYDEISFGFGMDLGEAAVSVSLTFTKQ